MSWPKMSVSGLVQVAILVPVPVLAVQKLKKDFLVENHKIEKNLFMNPSFIYSVLSYLKMSHHPNFCSSVTGRKNGFS